MLPIRHPKHRVRGIEILQQKAPEVWQELIDGIWWVLEPLPDEWKSLVKPELCGSSVFLFAKPWSDIDINLACDDWRTLHQFDYQVRQYRIRERLVELERKVGVSLQMATRTVAVDSPVAPNDLAGKYPVYSLRADRFFNKKPGTVFPHTLRWDKPTDWWQVVSPKIGRYYLMPEDEYPEEEVEKWRKVYGPDFLEVTPGIMYDVNGIDYHPKVS